MALRSFQTARDPGSGVLRACALEGDGPMSFAAVFGGWRSDPAFIGQWTAFLREIPLEAYCWEHPPLTRGTIDRPYECVFVESRTLAAAEADRAPFEERLLGRSGSVAFGNLGGDARLVAPCPADPATNYAHLAAFARSARPSEAEAFWSLVAQTLDHRLDDVPTWLSTAGEGVYWLHVRLDSRPKYYRHRDYVSPAFWSVRT